MRAARRTAAALAAAAALSLPASAAAAGAPPQFYGVVSQAGLADCAVVTVDRQAKPALGAFRRVALGG